ncbi:hypothetical protein [Leptospira borgpetersenii]|nr:hypothetical protein [Leptospira borgpetersenii]
MRKKIYCSGWGAISEPVPKLGQPCSLIFLTKQKTKAAFAP